MYTYKYPHPAVTADCAVFAPDESGALSVLLIERKNDPCKGCWALPGGFMNIDETAEEAAVRELYEETGIPIDAKNVRQIGAYTTVDRDPRERVITIAFLAVLPALCAVSGNDDARQAHWFRVDHLPPLAFDHAQVMSDALTIYNSPVQ
jgi:8-oxo-dGTP diphosphatase